jgi:hypothetical protein
MPPGFLGKHCPRKRTVTTSFISNFFALQAFNAYVYACTSFPRMRKKKREVPSDTPVPSTFDFEPMASIGKNREYSWV